MIFITLGSQKFQFNRLLKAIDNLISEGIIREKVFAQIGYSDYIPKNYEYTKFCDRNVFAEKMLTSDIVVTHGGTGAIITAVKNDKKVVAIARLKKYGEHVDDHQLDIVRQFSNMNLIEGIVDEKDLSEAIENVKCKIYSKYVSNTSNVINIIENFIEQN